MKVEVVRSQRRRKTVQARMVGEVLRLWIPANMSAAEEQHWISEMSRRLERQSAAGEIDLEERARKLAHRYLLPVPSSIRCMLLRSARSFIGCPAAAPALGLTRPHISAALIVK